MIALASADVQAKVRLGHSAFSILLDLLGAFALASKLIKGQCCRNRATGRLIKAAFATTFAAVENEVLVERIAIGISSILVIVRRNEEIALAYAGLFIEVWCVNACATGLFKAAFTTAVAAV